MPYNPMNRQAEEQINKAFTHYPPKEDQEERYEVLRASGTLLAADIMRACPASRERALAMTKLEEAVMWANKSIAVNE